VNDDDKEHTDHVLEECAKKEMPLGRLYLCINRGPTFIL
jgi:hypothetical protein